MTAAVARQIPRDIDQTGDQHEQQRRAAVAQPAEDGREQVIRDDEEGPAAADAYIARRERDGLGRGLHHHGDWPRQTDRHRKQQRGHEREHDRRTADDRADLFGAPLAEIARDQYRDAHGKLRHPERDKVEHLTARGDGGESRGRAEPPDDEQVDGTVGCLQNQRAEDGEHKEAELAQDAALRSTPLPVRVTPPRGICQALLTDAAYALSVKSAAKRLRIFALRL